MNQGVLGSFIAPRSLSDGCGASGRVSRIVVVALAICSSALYSQSIAVGVSNIPAQATAIDVRVDGGALQGLLTGTTEVSPGTSSTTLQVGVPAGGPYRVRVVAYVGAPVFPGRMLRSGKVTGIVVAGAGTVNAAVTLGDMVLTLDPATTSGAAPGSPVMVQARLTDPGEIAESVFSSSNLTGDTQPLNSGGFSGTGGGTQTSAQFVRTGDGQFSATHRFNLPTSGSTFYYWLSFYDSGRYLYAPAYGSPAYQMAMLPGPTIAVGVSNIPAQTTAIDVRVDGGALQGLLTGTTEVSPGTSSTTLQVGVPAGGPYRVRVVAYVGAPVFPGRMLRSGKVTGIVVAGAGTVNAAVTLGDMVLTLDPATTSGAAPGSPVMVQARLTDPGEIAESVFSSSNLTGDTQPLNSGGFSGTGGGTQTFAQFVRTGDGQFSATHRFNLPTSGSTFYYWLSFYDSGRYLYAPAYGSPAYQMAMLPGPTIAVGVSNIPAQTTAIDVRVDGGALQGLLTGTTEVSPGTSSTTLQVGVPAGGPYRVRVVAYVGAPVFPGRMLRSGKVTGIVVAGAGTVNAAVTLGDMVLTLDPATTSGAAPGSPVTGTGEADGPRRNRGKCVFVFEFDGRHATTEFGRFQWHRRWHPDLCAVC